MALSPSQVPASALWLISRLHLVPLGLGGLSRLVCLSCFRWDSRAPALVGCPYLGHACLPGACCALALLFLYFHLKPSRAGLSVSCQQHSFWFTGTPLLILPGMQPCRGLSTASLQPLLSSEIMTSGWSSDWPAPLLAEPPHPTRVRLSFPSSSVPSLIVPWVHQTGSGSFWPCSPLPPSWAQPSEAMQRAGWVCFKEESAWSPSTAWDSKNVSA